MGCASPAGCAWRRVHPARPADAPAARALPVPRRRAAVAASLGGAGVSGREAPPAMPRSPRWAARSVDATYFSPAVPSTHKPGFAVGAGKTAMDACVWLLQSGTPADAITWVMPRDSWVVNRLGTQNGPEFFNEAIGGQADQMQAFAEASSIDDLYLRLEACGALLRIDPRAHADDVPPGDAVRGEAGGAAPHPQRAAAGPRARRSMPTRCVLEQGRVPVAPGTLFIDCTASAVRFKDPAPVFQGGRIVAAVAARTAGRLQRRAHGLRRGALRRRGAQEPAVQRRCPSHAPRPTTRARWPST